MDQQGVVLVVLTVCLASNFWASAMCVDASVGFHFPPADTLCFCLPLSSRGTEEEEKGGCGNKPSRDDERGGDRLPAQLEPVCLQFDAHEFVYRVRT